MSKIILKSHKTQIKIELEQNIEFGLMQKKKKSMPIK